ncbi:MAG TPA: Na/Pi symporter [Calditerricola sp.]
MIKTVLIPFSVGLALFLFGLSLMRRGLDGIAGPRLTQLLASCTRTPVHGFVTGTAVTGILQSSSAVTVALVGLVDARALPFPATVGVILGTNVGTCFTVELLALNLDRFALPLVLVGAFLWAAPKRPLLRGVGLAIGGFGCLLVGLTILQSGARPLEETAWFAELFSRAQHSEAIALLFGLVFTALMQSSTAATAVAMSMAATDTFSVPQAIAFVLGANIGTCTTALLAAIGTSPAARRVAWCHFTFNVFGVVAAYPLLDALTRLVAWLSADPDTQVAHAQTLFNLFCSLVALPLARPYARWIERLF